MREPTYQDKPLSPEKLNRLHNCRAWANRENYLWRVFVMNQFEIKLSTRKAVLLVAAVYYDVSYQADRYGTFSEVAAELENGAEFDELWTGGGSPYFVMGETWGRAGECGEFTDGLRQAQVDAYRCVFGNPFADILDEVWWLPLSEDWCTWCEGKKLVPVVNARRMRVDGRKKNCPLCDGFGFRCKWKTTEVVEMAESIYWDRPPRLCTVCVGSGIVTRKPEKISNSPLTMAFHWKCSRCHDCKVKGWEAKTEEIPGYKLDNEALGILADRLQEQGFPDVTKCLACKGSGKEPKDSARVRKGKITFERMAEAWRSKFQGVCRACDGNGQVASRLLAHLREPGLHVRGCWALDVVRGYYGGSGAR